MAHYLLAFDIGNTNIKIGVFAGDSLAAHWRIATERRKLADEYAILLLALFASHDLAAADIGGCVISCVVPPLSSTFLELCRSYLGIEPVVVSHAIETGVRLEIENVHEVGADRLANVLATYRLYGGPAIAIAFGTATVFDVISADGAYLGGAIAPGLGIAADALFQLAARLYQVELEPPPHAIGCNTVEALQSGLMLGYAGLVEGLVRRIQAELGQEAYVVATGGLAGVIASQTDAIKTVNDQLTLLGLRFIYELNRGRVLSPASGG
jgi:type III pantothenate kinase